MTTQPTKAKKHLVICSIFALLLLFILLNTPLFKVELFTYESTLEIGTKASTNPDAYLSGPSLSVALSYVDTSSVKHTKAGRYPIYIYHGFNKYTSYVNVVDTTPPVVKSNIKNKTIASGDTISVHKLSLDIQDYSQIERILFTKITSNSFHADLPKDQMQVMQEAYAKGIPIDAEEFQFSDGGIYTLTISVMDAFYNTSETELTITVETPPVIEANQNFYIANTKEIDFRKYINVWDFLSDDIDVNNVKIDTSQLNFSSTGTYPVTLSVTDDYGLTASKTLNVHVSSQDALQELINTHIADLSKDTIIGAKNAYDSGYYPNSDISFIQNIISPTIVQIKNDTTNASGSGFIIEINDSFVTIATSDRVITKDLEVDITFFDSTECCGTVVATNKEKNIAFVRIPIKEMETNSKSALCSKYIQKLRTVHINKAYIDQLIKNHELETILSFEAAPNTSGSAIFDNHGHLIGMTQDISLNEILKYFESVFKYKIHYQ